MADLRALWDQWNPEKGPFERAFPPETTRPPESSGGSKLKGPTGEAPASLTARLPLDTSSKFKPEEPKSDDSYRIPMTRSDYSYELRAP